MRKTNPSTLHPEILAGLIGIRAFQDGWDYLVFQRFLNGKAEITGEGHFRNDGCQSTYQKIKEKAPTIT